MSSDFRLSSAWPVIPLADVVYFQEGPGLRNWQYREVGIPFVNIRCIKDGRLLRDEMTCLDPVEVEQKYQHFLLDAGDYVVSSSGTLGRLAEVFSDDLPCMLNTSVIRFRPKQSDSIDRRYLRYFLTSAVFEQQILAFANGSAQLNYGPSHLMRMGIVVPPKNVQVAIGELLGALDDRITMLRETNSTLEALAQALFKSWFVDFDPVRARADGKLPDGIDAATAALFPDAFEETELGLVPKGWRYSTVQNSFILTMGQSPPGSTYSTDNSDMPFYQGCTDFGFRFPTQRMYCSAPSRLAETGDTLVSVRAPVGDVNMAIEKCCIGRGLASVRHPKFQSFVFYAISNLGKHFKNFDTEGTIFGSINKADFQSLPVIDASLNVVTEFENITKQLDSKVVQNEHSLRVLSELRDTLLPRLISGQLRIADAETELERAIA
jgi:type I restriction enzyme S subunit